MTVTALMMGSEAWWQSKNGPEWEREDNGDYRVTFWWRDPQGSEKESAIRRVWVYITGVTDHHQNAVPQSMQRIDGTNVWCWNISLSANWRGSYCFIPSMVDRPFEPQGNNTHANMHSTRHWWQQVFASATHDLLNPYRAWPGVGGHYLSGLHMPQAPQQPAWQDFDNYAVTSGRCTPAPPAKLQRYTWHSQRLGTSRHVWVYTTGESHPAERPLAILLDGQFWARQMPVWDPLMQLTRAGQLPEAVYLLIDVIDQQHRARELTCNDEFWLALQEELLPQLADWAPHSREAASTVVAGQSFGGLGSLYAGLRWPEYFGATISQSGSFWWPRRDMLQLPSVPEDACWLIRQVEERQLGAHGKLKVFLEAGSHEKLVHRVNDQMAALLSATGHQVQYRLVEGGHDALCWRGGLMDGLLAHWADKTNRLAELNPSADPLHA